MIPFVYLIPLFPLIGFIINGLGWRSIPKSVGGLIGSASVLASFIVSLLVFFEVKAGASEVVTVFEFIQSGNLYIPFAFQVDALSALFLLIITGVGFLIHVYSASYMHEDEGMVKYFAFLNLFVFSMLLLVLGANYLIMYIGWEGVGLCSYLLIGFWYKNKDYAKAGKKAFVMNRIGDLGFLVGMLYILFKCGTLSYAGEDGVFTELQNGAFSSFDYNFIAICFFVGAIGKSAQIPLFTWLPDAMAGPTPVSALIHAATMVTAGIYMIARSSDLYNLAPMALEIVAWIGCFTALMAASIAIKQNDIKKVLAYSTVSQLGFMFMAAGMGAYTTAVFHVMTHAFFKALLFLGSGSVIHAMGGEQDIRKMGGLAKKMPITNITFLVGCLAIAGIPGFSGFFSKDEIMAVAFSHNKIIYILGLLAAMMTAFYMFRLYTLTFTGSFRGTQEQAHHLHESPAAITIPLMVLGILSIVGGYVGLPPVISHDHTLANFLSTAVTNAGNHAMEHSTEWMLIGASSAIAIVFSIMGYMAHKKAVFVENTGLAKVLENKWYLDELYESIITKPLHSFAEMLDKYAERQGIDGAVNGVGRLVQWSSDRVRLLQSGQVGFYLFAMVIGITVLFLISYFA